MGISVRRKTFGGRRVSQITVYNLDCGTTCDVCYLCFEGVLGAGVGVPDGSTTQTEGTPLVHLCTSLRTIGILVPRHSFGPDLIHGTDSTCPTHPQYLPLSPSLGCRGTVTTPSTSLSYLPIPPLNPEVVSVTLTPTTRPIYHLSFIRFVFTHPTHTTEYGN